MQTGVRAAFGGKHPTMGTHNALLSLGNRMYLEILAPDPDAPQVTGMLSGVKDLKQPRLFTWAAATSQIELAEERLRKAGFKTSSVQPGSRKRPDGSVLRWKTLKLTDVSDPVVPFLIEWDSEAMHPSVDSPPGCELESFAIEHPEPEKLNAIFQSMAVRITINRSASSRLIAVLNTLAGRVQLA